ncbi:MAG: gliding motility lipoprotein GldH [Chitinophagales bacterium]|jgi:gliding motility-associated lipoprotein GldH|nr:gliding motility lipoprotein GldH [Chitinophagales bacterium]HNI45320.1 gliding motility lipoprotein GldH [Chitinophagales bacterium]
MKYVVILLVSCVFWVGCGNKHAFEQYVNLPNYVWSKTNTVVINADLENDITAANVNLLVRYGTAYPFDALTVQVVSTAPNKKVQKANYSIPLRDAAGKNLGSGMGDMWDVSFPIAKNVGMQKGQYSFEISHTMEEDIIPMLVDIGLSIDDVKKQ